MDSNLGTGPSIHRSSVGEAEHDPSLVAEPRTQAPAWLLATAAVLASFLLITLVALAASRLDRPTSASDEQADASGERTGTPGKRVVDVERTDDGTARVTLEDGTQIDVTSRPDGQAEFTDSEGNRVVLRPDPNGDIVGVRVDEDGNIVPIRRGEPVGDDAILFGSRNSQGGGAGGGPDDAASGHGGGESINVDPNATNGPTVLIFDDEGNIVAAQPPESDPNNEPGSDPNGGNENGSDPNRSSQSESAQSGGEDDDPGLQVVLLLGAGVVGVLILLAVAGALIRRTKATPTADPTPTPPADPGTLEMVGVVEDLITRIRREPDPGRAIRLAYAHAEEAFANVAHQPRHHSETPVRYLDRILAGRADLGRPLRTLTDLFLRARYASHPLEEADKEQAIMALDEIRSRLLQPAHDQTQQAHDAVVGSSS